MGRRIPRTGGGLASGAKAGIFLAVLLLLAGFWMVKDKAIFHPRPQVPSPEAQRFPVHRNPVIDYNQIQKNPQLQALMKDRKEAYGVDAGVDMIAKPDETLKVGDSVVPMKEIIGKIHVKPLENVDRTDSGSSPPEDVYGIYVVRPGDNIWKIHYNILKGYFEKKGIVLPRWSDQPKRNGRSSGVGRILKFSETMVSIYNVKDRKLETDLNLLQPDSKIAVFNIGQTLDQFKQIDYRQLQHIRYNGKRLWMPAEK